MLKNYFKIAVRNLSRNKAFSFINIFGLAVGLATCFLIMLYIVDENSYDKHHAAADRVYRIASVSGSKDKTETWAATSAPVADGIQKELPEVEQVTRLMTFPDIATMLFKYNDNGNQKKFFETNGYYVDASFFQVLSYDFLFGNAATALSSPNSIVISSQLSKRFFGNTNPAGKALLINTPFGEFNYTVTAVFNSTAHKSHIAANYFLSMHNSDMWNWVQRQTSWSNNSVFFTYVKLKPATGAAVFEKKLNKLFQQQAGAEIKAAGFSKSLFIQPLKDIYLRSALGNEIGVNGSMQSLYILGCIGIFILLIACINFMNLSTARSEKRAKEVGVRKVMGAARSLLVWQFLAESILMSVLALAVALLMAYMFLPLFNQVTQKNITTFESPLLIVCITVLTLLTGILSGLYPAFYLSAFKPVAVLKGKIRNSFSAIAVRKGLVVFQFTVSVCLVLGAIVIWQQMELLNKKQLGFTKEQQLVLPLQMAYKNSEKDYTPLKIELSKNPSIAAISSGSAYPGVPNLNDMLFYAEGKAATDIVDIHLAGANDNYVETLGLTILSGRSFSQSFTADSNSIILNETAVKDLGYTIASAPGKQIQYNYGGHRTMQIVGVVKDFNFESLHNEIKPFGLTTGAFANKYGFLIARIRSTNYAGLLKQVEQTWSALNPGVPFVYSFIDQDFQRNYEKEQQSSDILVSFTAIAIVIACLGLFGLAAFSAEQRTKEIGIRKVLGASAGSVMALLSSDFIKLVFIAILIASPIAWFCMTKWLQGFAYKVIISWWMFAIAGLLAIIIALLTVSAQALKAAMRNPIKSLRTE